MPLAWLGALVTGRRLLSLAALLDSMIWTSTARIGGMDRRSLRDLLRRFNDHGPEGPMDDWAAERGAAGRTRPSGQDRSRPCGSRRGLPCFSTTRWMTHDRATGGPRQDRHDPAPLPAPERTPLGNVWRYLLAKRLSSHVFATFIEFIDAACGEWNRTVGQPDTIRSIGSRERAQDGEPWRPLVVGWLFQSDRCELHVAEETRFEIYWLRAMRGDSGW